MSNTLPSIQPHSQNPRVQKIYELGFLVALLMIIMAIFLFFYYAVPGFTGLILKN